MAIFVLSLCGPLPFVLSCCWLLLPHVALGTVSFVAAIPVRAGVGWPQTMLSTSPHLHQAHGTFIRIGKNILARGFKGAYRNGLAGFVEFVFSRAFFNVLLVRPLQRLKGKAFKRAYRFVKLFDVLCTLALWR